MKLVTVSEMQRVEKESDAAGHTYDMMMEQAGTGLARVLHSQAHRLHDASALGLVGSGNNGGDTLVALAYLAEQHDWRVSAWVVQSRPEDDPLVERFLAAGGQVVEAEEDPKAAKLAGMVGDHSVVVDGVLGTGIRLPLKGEIPAALTAVKAALEGLDLRPLVVAVDCPSGVDCDTGAAAPEALAADLTVTMAAVKQGLLRFPAFQLLGELRLVGIGLPDGLKAWGKINREAADADLVRAILPPRPLDAHKGTFGTALVVGGSVNYTGAVQLCGQAAYRVGAGLVTLGVPGPLHAPLAGSFPEATWVLLPHEVGVLAEKAADVLLKNKGRATAMAIGPGMGQEDASGRFLASLLGDRLAPGPTGIGFVSSRDKSEAPVVAELPPLVVDADGLKLLADLPGWPEKLPAPAVLTPHPGEMAVMTGLDVDEIQSDRLKTAERFAAEWGHVVVLKGACTVVVSPDGRSTVIPIATPALARAGTGDVLTGLVVGLRAQGVDAYEAGVAAAWIHARAGQIAAEILGSSAAVLAGDVLDAVADVLAEL